MKQRFFVVVNGAGFVTCTTDDGTNMHHAALWTSQEAAQRHADLMLEIQLRNLDLRHSTTPTRFDVIEVEIDPSNKDNT